MVMNELDSTLEAEAILNKKYFIMSKQLTVLCFVVYLFTVLWYTIGRRSVGYYPAMVNLFWSYEKWFQGERTTGMAILANIAMFIPFGFFMAELGEHKHRKSFLSVIAQALVFSTLIEISQMILMRGYFEFDDILNNTAGAVIGTFFFQILIHRFPERFSRPALNMANVSMFSFCLLFFVLVGDSHGDNMLPLSQGLCFQVEDASYQQGNIDLSGVCFWYNRQTQVCAIQLQSMKTAKCYPLHTKSGLVRPDVSEYFHQRDLKAGFHASGQGIAVDEEYEILLDYGWFRLIPTGLYLVVKYGTPQQPPQVVIRYTRNDIFVEPGTNNNDLEQIVSKGTLLVYRPEFHIYVYACEGKLFWVAEDGFKFEEDGSTFMNAVLWTTEPEKISEKSKARGLLFDALGTTFERAELEGNFGQYRVCAWQLPTDYPITSLRLGYYSGAWLWTNTCWPVYNFSPVAAETVAG